MGWTKLKKWVFGQTTAGKKIVPAMQKGMEMAKEMVLKEQQKRAGLTKELSAAEQTAMGALSPYAAAGGTAMGGLMEGLGFGGDPSSVMSKLQEMPGYQFRLQEGQKAVERMQSARGGSFGGRAMKEMAKFGEGLASEEYSNYMGRLQNIAGMGMGAAGQQAGIAMQAGMGRSNIGMDLYGMDVARRMAKQAQDASKGGGFMSNLFSTIGGAVAGKAGEAAGNVVGKIFE